MKRVILAVLLFASFSSIAQTMTEEEKQLRKEANFSAFIYSVKNNTKADCLCKNNELVVFSFRTGNNKIASLCVSKKVSVSNGYLAYRFGTKAKTELSFPTDTLNSFSQFSYGSYYRGGGKQNAAMYVNSLHFTNGDYTYTLHDDWTSEDDHYAKGIIILNNTTGKSTTIKSKGKVTGSLAAFSNGKVVKETDEL